MVAEEKIIERKLIRFEGFTLDVSKRALFRGHERVRLTSKPLETLIFLVENRGRVAEKPEILDAVWKDTFVTDDVLVQAVKEIRRVLEDNKEEPRFIQTVPRQGYRFIGDVSVELPFVKSEISERVPLIVVPKQGPERSKMLPLSFAALIGVGLIAIIVWFVWKRDVQLPQAANRDERSATDFGPQPLRHLPTGEFPVGKPAFSPDGELILYVGSSRETEGYGDIVIMSASGGGSVRITEKSSPSGDLPVFTADGSHVVFSRPRGGEEESRLLDLYIVPTSGGEMKIYLPEASGAGFSPDGRWVAYTKHLQSQKVLWLSPTNDLTEHREIAIDGFTPRWSADGKSIAYTTSNPNGGVGDLWIVDADTLSDRKNLTQEPQQIYGLTWAVDNRSIIFSSKRTGLQLLWKISIADRTIRQVPTDVGEGAAPSTSPDGKTLVFHNVRVAKDLMLADSLQETESQQITHDEYHQWLKLSPSGGKAASIVQRPDIGGRLHVTDLKTKQTVRLSNDPAHHPDWLDEENVAYLLRAAGVTKVQVVNLTSRVTTPLTQFSGLAEWLSIHPDKRKIAVVLTSADAKQTIVLRDLENESDQTIAEGGDYSALDWLPNGSGLSWSGPWQASPPASDGIWMYDLAHQKVRRLVGDGYGPTWDADGKNFYYSRSREFAGLWRFDISRQQTNKIRSWTEGTYFDIAGKRLLYAQGKGRGQIYSMMLLQ